MIATESISTETEPKMPKIKRSSWSEARDICNLLRAAEKRTDLSNLSVGPTNNMNHLELVKFNIGDLFGSRTKWTASNSTNRRHSNV